MKVLNHTTSDRLTRRTRLAASLLSLVALVGVAAMESSTADAAIKVCTGRPNPGSVCGNIGGPYWG